MNSYMYTFFFRARPFAKLPNQYGTCVSCHAYLTPRHAARRGLTQALGYKDKKRGRCHQEDPLLDGGLPPAAATAAATAAAAAAAATATATAAVPVVARCAGTPPAATPTVGPEEDGHTPAYGDRHKRARYPSAAAHGRGGGFDVGLRSALYAAVCAGHAGEAWELMLNGAEVNQRDPVEGRTVAEAAVRGEHETVAIGLFARGAEVNVRCVRDGSLLHVAAMEGKHGIVKAILASGGDKDAKDDFGETPLIKACQFGREAVVGTLISAGCDVNVWGAGPSSCTALDRAAQNG